MGRVFLFSLLSFVGLAFFVPADQPDIFDLTEHRQEYIYDVHYGFMRLGSVRLTPLEDTVFHGKPAFYYRTIIESNPSIPFVGYKEMHYHSIFALNDTIPYGLKFWSDRVHRNIEREFEYIFDYEQGFVFSFQQGKPLDTLVIDRPGDSGPAFYYYSRLHAGTNRQVSYPIYIDDRVGFAEISYSSKKGRMRSTAMNNRMVDTYTATGTADFEGPFGFSGDFTAAFKTDPCRTPLEARVRVWVGSVRVHLREANSPCFNDN